jgi:hypothetical protein
MIDDGYCEETGGMKIGWGNQSTCIKPAPISLCLPQIPHDLTRVRNRVAAVGSRRITNCLSYGTAPFEPLLQHIVGFWLPH